LRRVREFNPYPKLMGLCLANRCSQAISAYSPIEEGEVIET
jgi:hypothetical protein